LRLRVLTRAVTTCVAASLVVTSGATAASSLSVSGDTITLTDTAGERNYVTVNHGNVPDAVASVDDHVGILPIAPCGDFSGIGYTCPTSVRPTFVLDLGAGDDFAQVVNFSAAGTHSELRGGDGNDTLWSYEGSDSLDGGPGDDELVPDDVDPSPGDDVRGGPGTDHLQLAPVLSSEVVATLDDRADDGQPGHSDNYHSDIENVTGAHNARNTIVGTAGPNVLTGQEQADRLTGAGGRDTLDGGGGSDTIDALDGMSGDRVTCGDGADVVYVDAGDVVADECEQTTWAPGVSSKLRYRAHRIAVRVSCPRSSRTGCRGTLRLATTQGRTLATARYRVQRNRSATASLHLKRKPPRSATLTVAPGGTKPIAGRAVRIV
jgi:Ca2+-binding RTX toxin-like protein